MRLKPIYTDTDMCDSVLKQEIERSVEGIHKLMGNFPPLPGDWELALELGKDSETGENICSYYFICHTTRCLFWLHEFDLENVLENVGGVTEKTHIRESTPAPGIHQTKHMARSGIASSVLVGSRHIVTTASWLTTSGIIGRRSRITGKFPRPFSRNYLGSYFTRGSVSQGQCLMWYGSQVAQTV